MEVALALPREAEVAGALSLQPPISHSSRHTARMWSVLGMNTLFGSRTSVSVRVGEMCVDTCALLATRERCVYRA